MENVTKTTIMKILHLLNERGINLNDTATLEAVLDGIIEEVSKPEPEPTPAPEPLLKYETVRFGKYDWRVLAQVDNRQLIITDKTVDSRVYHNARTDVTWEKCDLRKYLNTEFLRNFSAQEQEKIVSVKNQNPCNPWFGTNGGNTTEDKVFLLSIDEAVRYFGDSGQLGNETSNNKNRKKTWIDDEFNDSRIALDSDGNPCWWWFRSPGHNGESAAGVDGGGGVGVLGDSAFDIGGGVRPVMWVTV